MSKKWEFSQTKINKQAAQAWNRLERAIHFRHHQEYHLYGGRRLKFEMTRDQFIGWFSYHVTVNKIVDPAVTLKKPFGNIRLDNIVLDTKGVVLAYRNRVEREIEEGQRQPQKHEGDIQLEFIQIPRPKVRVDNVTRAKTAWRNIRAKCTKPHNKWYHLFGAKGIELRADQKEFVSWFVEEQSKNDFAKPAVIRKNEQRHFDLGNLKLVEMSELMAKSGVDSIPIALVPQIGKPLWCRSIADAARYLKVHPTTIRTALKSGKPVKGLFRVTVDPGKQSVSSVVKWSAA